MTQIFRRKPPLERTEPLLSMHAPTVRSSDFLQQIEEQRTNLIDQEYLIIDEGDEVFNNPSDNIKKWTHLWKIFSKIAAWDIRTIVLESENNSGIFGSGLANVKKADISIRIQKWYNGDPQTHIFSLTVQRNHDKLRMLIMTMASGQDAAQKAQYYMIVAATRPDVEHIFS